LFDDGAKLMRLGEFYARRLVASGVAFDMLFGPAYKGITLAAAVAIEFGRRGRAIPFAFNRKEAKDHGEGGLVRRPPAMLVTMSLTKPTAPCRSTRVTPWQCAHWTVLAPCGTAKRAPHWPHSMALGVATSALCLACLSISTLCPFYSAQLKHKRQDLQRY
jgi:hypothetical protein